MNKDHLPQSLLCLLAGILIVFWVLTSTGCKSTFPSVDVTFWAGDPGRGGISRSQEERTMACTDGEFAEYACLTYVDLKKIYDMMLSCKEWGTAPMNSKESKQFMKKNKEVLIKTAKSPREVYQSETERKDKLRVNLESF